MKANDLSKFKFDRVSNGAYNVTYTTQRGDYFLLYTNDMTIIDATKNSEYAKLKDIEELRNKCVRYGTHYHSNGRAFAYTA